MAEEVTVVENKVSEESMNDMVLLNDCEKRNAVEQLSSYLVLSGAKESDAFKFSSLFCSNISKKLFNEIIKKFQDKPNTKAHLGVTDPGGNDSHTHTFVTLVLNWGEQLVGVTTGTKKGVDHVHMINIAVDSRIISMTAITNLSEYTDKKKETDYHYHSFEIDINELKNNNPSIYVKPYVFAENSFSCDKDKEMEGKDKKKKDEEDKEYIEVGKFGDRSIGFSNKRQAEVLLVNVCQMSDNPAWNDKTLEELQEAIYVSVEKNFSDSKIFDDNWVAEFAEYLFAKELDPKAKVRNRGSVAVPASQAKDKKDHFPANCLKGDTKIALLDGTEKTIEELVGKEVWVYAYDINRKAVVPALAKNIRKTGINSEVIKIILDNGKEIICTGHHPIMVRSGEYKLAGDLVEGESLMPLHLSIWGQPENYPKFIKNGYHSFYNQVYQPFYKRWEAVHEVVARDINVLEDNPSYVIHHNDRNKLNNVPSNLIVMNKSEHSRLHGLETFRSPEFKKNQRDRAKKASKARWENKEYRVRQSLIMKKDNIRRNLDPIYHQKLSEGVKRGRINARLLKENLTISQQMKLYEEVINSTKTFNAAAEKLNIHPNTLRRRMRSLGMISDKVPILEKNISSDEFNKNKEYYSNLMKEFLTIKEAAKHLGIHDQTLSRKLHFYGVYLSKVMPSEELIDNHKIIKIEKAFNCDVYDMEVPEYHNFGLASGIFVHNSIAQARNALARVAQYKTAPSWWGGSLASLQKKVRDFVKGKYPQIKVTGLSEMFAIRFKSDSNAFFINCASADASFAKEDAFIYLNECHGYDIDLVKFTLMDDETVTFKELGNFLFYDDRTKGTIKACSEKEISLSDRDSEGNLTIEILRTGKFNHPEYGQFEISTQKLNEIIKNFNAKVLDREVSFDFNHESDLPAAAWVSKLSTAKRDFKGNMQTVLIASTKLTTRGEEAVKNGDFKYFSSEYVDNFIDKETGYEYGTTLKGGGLTNRPWIPGLKPIVFSEKRNKMGFISNN